MGGDDGIDGADGLLWCYGGMVPPCLEAVAHLRDAEGLHIDLAIVSQLSPIPSSHIDLLAGAGGPPLMVYVEEASVEHGWSAELLAQVEARSAAGVRQHYVRVGAAHTPIASSRHLERQSLPHAGDIVARVLECL